ncbi:flowering-promoting factor 1 [Vigna radiata var. radiata]|uniref:Flowering-promoting factor 1 n=1 Tax=Vigna radiata var. radiata TaxID=3916 RepID=A0A1S3U7T4_VIGRR|nr:flowering-promoting factor 1 [Vigna radiata var. radiata]
MSGVWVFKNGVVRLMENPESEILEKKVKGKVLVDMASGEPITSYTVLERKLKALGWERYYDDPNLLQFHKTSSIDLISLPKDFTNFTNIHMYDIVIKNRNYFQVTDM